MLRNAKDRMDAQRAMAHETAAGLVSCRHRGDQGSDTKLLLQAYADTANERGIPQVRAQSLLMQALTAIALGFATRAAVASDLDIDDVLRAEARRVASWAAQHAQ